MAPLDKYINDPKMHKWALEQIDLAKATQTAVRKRRQELNDQLFNLMTWPETRMGNETYVPETKSINQIAAHDLEKIVAIKRELQIIENLMIKTNHEYEKLGHKVGIYIKAGKEVRKIQ